MPPIKKGWGITIIRSKHARIFFNVVNKAIHKNKVVPPNIINSDKERAHCSFNLVSYHKAFHL